MNLEPRRLGLVVVSVVVAVALSSAAVGALEGLLGVPNASSLYLVGVAALAIGVGVAGAALAAAASVVTYDLLFTEPRLALTVTDPGEWLNLVLLLFVAVTVGQLAAIGRRRAEAAAAREREARALFDVTRTLASMPTTVDALPAIAAALARDARMSEAWFTLGSDDADERVVGEARGAWAVPRGYAVLREGNEPGVFGWTIVRNPTGRAADTSPRRHFRVRLTDGGASLGSLWTTRNAPDGLPDEVTSRLLRVTADLVSQALAHDRLEEERRRAEIAQQSDAVKSALLESVSHDLRTPLASIRAFAGTLMDPSVRLSPDEARASAASIDREAQRLNRLVGNLLDLSRIEGGVLRVTSDVLDVEDVVERVVAQSASRGDDREIRLEIEDGSLVIGDPVLLEQALLNLVDNATRHTPPDAPIRVTATGARAGLVRLTVEDGGAGVPDVALPRLFDRFFSLSAGSRGARGTGLGLAVVRGFVEAMGGTATARRSSLGGLAVDLELVAAALPSAAAAGSHEA